MASDYIISWEIDGENVETVTDFTYLDSKITLDYDCAMKLKDVCFFKKVMTNIGSILESRDITLLTKIRIVKIVVFPVVM